MMAKSTRVLLSCLLSLISCSQHSSLALGVATQMWALTLVLSPAGSGSISLWTVLGKQGSLIGLGLIPQSHPFEYVECHFNPPAMQETEETRV